MSKMNGPDNTAALVIWKFASAPEWVRSLHEFDHEPKWALQAPLAMAVELIDALLEGLPEEESKTVYRYLPFPNLVIYIGTEGLPISMSTSLLLAGCLDQVT